MCRLRDSYDALGLSKHERGSVLEKSPSKQHARCPVCKVFFIPNRSHQIYCDPKCRWHAWLLRKVAQLRDTEVAK